MYLNELDHFVKEELRCRAYVRYADDFVLFADDKERLWAWRQRMADRLASLRLVLHADKTAVSRTRQGLKFLGFKLYPSARRMLRESVRRFRRRVLHYRDQVRQRLIPPTRLTQAMRAWIAHSRYANSEGLRRRLFRELFGPRHGICPRRPKAASAAGAAVVTLLRSKSTRGQSP